MKLSKKIQVTLAIGVVFVTTYTTSNYLLRSGEKQCGERIEECIVYNKNNDYDEHQICVKSEKGSKFMLKNADLYSRYDVGDSIKLKLKLIKCDNKTFERISTIE